MCFETGDLSGERGNHFPCIKCSLFPVLAFFGARGVEGVVFEVVGVKNDNDDPGVDKRCAVAEGRGVGGIIPAVTGVDGGCRTKFPISSGRAGVSPK